MVDTVQDYLGTYYLWVKSLHVIAVIAWMAAMLYLPRLFAYHAGVRQGSDQDALFQIMERRLLKIIMTPAMVTVWIFGILMIVGNPDVMKQGWMHLKMTLVIILSALHGYFAVETKRFARGAPSRSARFYKIINEIPAVLMVIIVICAIAEPF